MNVIEYWEVIRTHNTGQFDSDEWTTTIACFSNEFAAKELASTDVKYSYIKKTTALFDSVDQYNDRHNESVKAAGIAKLTVAERIALKLL